MESAKIIRWCVGLSSIVGLLMIFLYQRVDVSEFFGVHHKTASFFINRSVRFVLNDFLAIGLIYALFCKRQYVLFAVIVQLFGLVFFLFPYFLLKMYWPLYNGPLINFLHRIILNPVLVLLLIPAFYYQNLKNKN